MENTKNKDKNKQTTCRLCGENGVNFWFEKNNNDVYKCPKCKLIFVHPIPNNMENIYSENYFCGANEGFGYINYDEDKNDESEEFKKYLDKIEKQYPDKGSLLDVGAATGSFMTAAKKRGWNVSGVEISDFAAETGRQKGLDIKTGILENCGYEKEYFDIITLWDVFEHISNPQSTLAHIKKILKPGGLIVMNLPDSDSLFARLMGKKWALIIPPEHLHLFSIHNLKILLERNQFSLISKDTIGKKFKLAYVFHALYTIRHKKIWRKISNLIKKTPLNNLSVLINLRDNMFVIAKKQ